MACGATRSHRAACRWWVHRRALGGVRCAALFSSWFLQVGKRKEGGPTETVCLTGVYMRKVKEELSEKSELYTPRPKFLVYAVVVSFAPSTPIALLG